MTNNNGFWLDDWICWHLLLQSLVITVSFNNSQYIFSSILIWSNLIDLSLFWSALRLTSPLVCLLLVSDLVLLSTAIDSVLESSRVESSLMLRPTVNQPGCLGIKHPSRAYDQIFITVRQLWVCWCGAFSLTRGRVCRAQLLLVLASAVIIRSESLGTRDHILLSQIRDFLLSPPTTRRATMEVFGPTSSRN
jgi:hypothetical protein